MRFLFIVTHTLPLFTLYADSFLCGEFGYRESHLFKNYIHTTTFNEDYFSNSVPHIGYQYPSPHQYNILLHGGDLFHLEVTDRDQYFTESIEIILLNDKTYHLSNFNIFSHNLLDEETSLHHSIFWKRSGIYSYGLLTIFNFSPLYKMGNKTLIFSDLDLYNFQLQQLFESRIDYLNPEMDNQNDLLRCKNILTFNKAGSLIPELYQQTTYEELVFDFTNRVKLTKLFNSADLSIQFQHRYKELTELSYKIDLNLYINILSINLEPTISYITHPMYKHISCITMELPKSWKTELKHQWEYIEEHSNKITMTLNREVKRYRFTLKFTQEWEGSESDWKINGSISLKGY